VPQATTAEFRQVFSLLARGYIQSVSTGTPGPEADIIRQLIELVAPGTRVALANKYLARLPLVDKKGFDSGGHAGAAELLEGIDLFVADDADAWPTDGWVVVPGAGENFLNLAMKLRERSALLPHLTSGEVIDSRIAMSASSADEFRFADQRFMALACSAVKVNWQPYIDSIEQTLVQPKTGVVATAFYALTVLCERNEGNVKNLAVRMMADSGNGHVLFRNAIELTDETTFARALVAFLRLRQGTIPALPYPVSTWCDRMPELPTALSHALKLMTPDRGAALTGLDVIEAADSRLDVRRIAEQTITARADT
jgi:hypothetical protein